LAFVCAAPKAYGGAVAQHELSVRGELNYEILRRHAAVGTTIRIKSSPGGTGAAAMQLARMALIVDGPCNSACAWAFVHNERACFTSRAIFGFHALSDPGTGLLMPVATNYWLSNVRASLRPQLEVLLSSQRLVYVSAKTMTAHYGDRRCR
jgi:hypothetical protein